MLSEGGGRGSGQPNLAKSIVEVRFVSFDESVEISGLTRHGQSPGLDGFVK